MEVYEMRESYDFSNATRNPHAKKLEKGYTLIIEHKDYDEIIKIEKTLKDKNEQKPSLAPSR